MNDQEPTAFGDVSGLTIRSHLTDGWETHYQVPKGAT